MPLFNRALGHNLIYILVIISNSSSCGVVRSVSASSIGNILHKHAGLGCLVNMTSMKYTSIGNSRAS